MSSPPESIDFESSPPADDVGFGTPKKNRTSSESNDETMLFSPSEPIAPVDSPPPEKTAAAAAAALTSTTTTTTTFAKTPAPNALDPVIVENATPATITTTTNAEAAAAAATSSVAAVLPSTETKHRHRPLQLALPPSSMNSTGSDTNNSFAEVVKERTRLRRERETAAVSALTIQVSRLEKALQAESKRRAGAIAAVKDQANREIRQMEETIRKQMHKEAVVVEQRLRTIEERLSLLEDRWQSDITTLNTDLERNRREMDAQIKELYTATEKERQDRMAREKMLVTQLEQVSSDYQERWTTERTERMKSVQSIQDTAQQQESNREQIMAKLQNKIKSELESLQLDLEREVVERQGNDEEIVNALNRYTQQLQQTLNYATST